MVDEAPKAVAMTNSGSAGTFRRSTMTQYRWFNVSRSKAGTPAGPAVRHGQHTTRPAKMRGLAPSTPARRHPARRTGRRSHSDWPRRTSARRCGWRSSADGGCCNRARVLAHSATPSSPAAPAATSALRVLVRVDTHAAEQHVRVEDLMRNVRASGTVRRHVFADPADLSSGGYDDELQLVVSERPGFRGVGRVGAWLDHLPPQTGPGTS